MLTKIDELFAGYNVGYLLDLNAGDGKTCVRAIMRGISVVAITFNKQHRDLLYAHLESEVFKAMQQPDSELYEPGLLSLLGTKKRKNKVPSLRLNFWGHHGSNHRHSNSGTP